MVCVMPTSGFDIAVTANSYSAAAGVLAGFAFSAVLFVLTTGVRTPTIAVSHAATAFTCAFFTLALSTIEYAVLAGEPGTGREAGRAVLEGLTNGSVFGLGVLLLFYGLRQLLPREPEFRGAARSVGLVVFGAGPLIVLAFIYAAAVDVEAVRGLSAPAGTSECALLSPTLRFGLYVLIASILVVLLVVAPRPRSAWAAKRRDAVPTAFCSWLSRTH